MKKKYRVWFSIDQAYEVEAKDEEEAKEMIMEGNVGDECIVEEKNHEWQGTEEIKK